MSLTNSEIFVKIVYWGPGKSGKTSSLERIYARYKNRINTNMAMVKTVEGKGLLLDFLAIDVGKIQGVDVRIQLFTVPGEIKHQATRRLVLKGADGIVFVADSMVLRRQDNIHYLTYLQEHLAAQKNDISKIPLVFQYNKRDLKEQGIPILSIETLEEDLNTHIYAPFFETSAFTGKNIVAAMKKAISLSLSTLHKELKYSNR
jgi:small GTP-binding protein